MRLSAWVIIVVLAILVIALVAPHFAAGNKIATTREGGAFTIGRLEEWAKWMTGIETAGLAGLAFLLFDQDGKINPLNNVGAGFGLAAGTYLGAALLCASWIFSSLGSAAVRIHSTDVAPDTKREDFDVTEALMFSSPRAWLKLRLSYLLAVHHILWSLGLLALAALMLNRVFVCVCW